ncbi:MAG: o-succinylbenzoate synthase [Bacteroidia bacterium]
MLEYQISEHRLDFKKAAKTSRNSFESRTIYTLEFKDLLSGKKGIGEAAALSLLSIDDIPNYREKLEYFSLQIANGINLKELDLTKFPSIEFGLETALLDMRSSDHRLYDTPFTNGLKSIPINGLVWMDHSEAMLKEALDKVNEGFNCIKFKIGALDFDEECRMLEQFRRHHNAFKVEIRLDANGAFLADEADKQLKELKRFDVHSIEQPIKVNQWDKMGSLCSKPAIDIALDEELIGLNINDAEKMLQHIQPQYIILKPNLIGGLEKANQWISLAGNADIAWWATSALESNIGLNAIAQWVSQYDSRLHQGLGTGSLYKNNFPTRLTLENGFMSYKPF